MKLLLRADVSGVGKKGDIVEVADGYGRNYLLPKGFAVAASKGVEAQAAAMRRSRDARDVADRTAATEIATKLVPAVITLSGRVKADDELFGSLGATEIVEAVAAQTGLELDRHALGTVHLRTIGTHAVPVKLHADVQFELTIEVSPA